MSLSNLAAPAVLVAALAFAPVAMAKPHGQDSQNTSATGGSAGSAAAGGTSASSLGVGATSVNGAQSSSALGMGGSAAAVNGKAKSRAAVHGGRNLNGQAMAMAHDGGTFSKSHTHCKDQTGQDVNCRTKSMSHVPGQKPAMSTNTTPGQPGATR